jgi:glycerol-3-phosphate acyltransferase PlsY
LSHSSDIFYLTTIAIFSFILGSIPFGYLIAKYKGINIREHGSGNIGATNVYRTIGKKEGVLTLFFDLAKGLVCVLAARLIFNDEPIFWYIAAIFSVFGHDFSLFLKFKGGKGVATSYGVTLALSFYSSLIGMIIWIVILIKTKYSSLAALLSFSISTLLCFIFFRNGYIEYIFLFLLAVMIMKHKDNIKRMLNREEKSINL